MCCVVIFFLCDWYRGNVVMSEKGGATGSGRRGFLRQHDKAKKNNNTHTHTHKTAVDSYCASFKHLRALSWTSPSCRRDTLFFCIPLWHTNLILLTSVETPPGEQRHLAETSIHESWPGHRCARLWKWKRCGARRRTATNGTLSWADTRLSWMCQRDLQQKIGKVLGMNQFQAVLNNAPEGPLLPHNTWTWLKFWKTYFPVNLLQEES